MLVRNEENQILPKRV